MLSFLRQRVYQTFPALSHRNFRLFWCGQCISLIGTWMQNVGQSWLVYTLTDSPFLLGLVGALQFTPMMLFSLFAGTLVDKLPKRKILIFTQATLMLLALTLAILVATGAVQYWHVLILATILGFVNTLDMPTRQAFMIELVGKEHLTNAIALNSSIFNGARIIGPAVAGWLMMKFDIAFCFFGNALSFLAVIYGLTQMKVAPMAMKKKSNTNILQDIGEGLRYIANTPILRNSILLVAIVGTFTFNYSVLLPVFSRKVLMQQDASGYSFLMSSLGVGSFIGALTIAARSKSAPRSHTLFFSATAIAILLMLVPATSIYAVTALTLVITGFFNISFSATANSTVQINSKDELRGRVMSVYSLVFGGTTPIGNMISGLVANHVGPRAGFIVNGAITLILILVLFSFKNRSEKQTIPGNQNPKLHWNTAE